MTFNLFSLCRLQKKSHFRPSSSTLAKISSFIFMYCAFTYKITPPRLNLFFHVGCLHSLHCVYLSSLYYNFFTFFTICMQILFSLTKRWCREESRLKHSAVQHSIKAFKRHCTTCMHNFFSPAFVIFLARNVKAWKSRRNFLYSIALSKDGSGERVKNVKNKSNFHGKIQLQIFLCLSF
jgi:hypothetical protein